MQRLTELNRALIKARTERVSKEALYNQLKSMQAPARSDTFPAVLANDYIQGLKTNLAHCSGSRHSSTTIRREPSPDERAIRRSKAVAKLRAEISKVEEGRQQRIPGGARAGAEPAGPDQLSAERSDGPEQDGDSLAGPEREADSNREVYEDLLQHAKEAGITGERRPNIRVIDPAELPRGPISPNLRGDMTFAWSPVWFSPSAWPSDSKSTSTTASRHLRS